jgi:MFS family permease
MTEDLKNLRGYQLRLLAILALINFVNFADRTVILPLFPLLREQFSASDAQLGSLQFWLQVVLALATIPFGLLADRFSRTRIIAAGVILWSLATFVSGMAGTFMMLLMARAMVGLGEAAYGPAAQSMISGAFSAATRARSQAVFAAGMLIGGTAGQALGGLVGEAYGWRPAFYLVGLPGLILGLSVLRLEEPPRGPRSEVVPVLRLLRVPAYVALIIGGVLITFAGVSFITWGPDYVVRFKGFSLREAGVSLGTIGFVSLVVGVLVGGYVADRLQKRWIHGRVITIAVAFLLAAPFILWSLAAEGKGMVLTAFFIAGFFMSWYHGPVTAIIHDLVPRRAHATSVGVYMFITQLVGAFGPQLVGNISDKFDLRAGLEVAVSVMVLGALVFFLTAYLINRDGLRHPALDVYRAESGE